MNQQREVIYCAPPARAPRRPAQEDIIDLLEEFVGKTRREVLRRGRARAAAGRSCRTNFLVDLQMDPERVAEDSARRASGRRSSTRRRSSTGARRRGSAPKSSQRIEKMVVPPGDRRKMEGPPAGDGRPEGGDPPPRLRPEGPAGRVQDRSVQDVHGAARPDQHRDPRPRLQALPGAAAQ